MDLASLLKQCENKSKILISSTTKHHRWGASSNPYLAGQERVLKFREEKKG